MSGKEKIICVMFLLIWLSFASVIVIAILQSEKCEVKSLEQIELQSDENCG